MLRNYLVVALRNLIRNRAFSAINITGLALGLATCLLIGLYVGHELSYDRFHEKADRIVRVVFRGQMNGEKMREAVVMAPVAGTLRADFPEIEAATRIRGDGKPRVTYGGKTFSEEELAYVDSNFFEVFTLPLRKGDARTALRRPNTLVLSATTARKYFGDADPLGKVLTFKGSGAVYTVTGVMDDVPSNSHFHFDLFASMAGFPEATETNWLRSNFYTYLVLPEGYDYRRLEAKLPQVVERHMGPALEKMTGTSLAQFRKNGNNIGLFLQPLTDIHLYSDLTPTTEMEPGGDARYVYVFGAIAIFMLLLACINFTNLSTAGAARRAKEVGVRKVMGSARGALVRQFLTESALLTALSLLLALVLVYAALPLFNQFSDKTLNLDLLRTPWFLPGLVALGLLVSLLAGGYPAFFLSSFQPIATLKGGAVRVGAGRHSLSLRSGLVVFQFFVSVSLIIGTVVVYQQLRYIQHTRLGYDKEQVLVVQNTWMLGGQNEEVLRQKLLQDARVVNASISGYLPAGPSNNGLAAVQPDGNELRMTRVASYGVDHRYLPTLGMQLAAGRNFSPHFPTDSTAVLINETAARTFGWTEDPLQHFITLPPMPGSGNPVRKYRVVGVVRDFHFRSLHEPIGPLMMFRGGNGGSIVAKVRTPDVTGLLASLKKEWSAFGTEEPFRYSFLDQSYQATYEAELKTGQILALFAGITVFVACLGLFGLAAFTAERRTKEIGVRKVLGASVGSIVVLLSRDFLKPVGIAIALASPVAWYAMHQWLEDFAYRTDIGWWVFAVAALLAVVIALLTVSYQSIKAALTNPVKSLRNE
jgi:putative ABC transport system permease protein